MIEEVIQRAEIVLIGLSFLLFLVLLIQKHLLLVFFCLLCTVLDCFRYLFIEIRKLRFYISQNLVLSFFVLRKSKIFKFVFLLFDS